jgi:hypothetical protein
MTSATPLVENLIAAWTALGFAVGMLVGAALMGAYVAYLFRGQPE